MKANWIKPEDRLPLVGETVLVCHKLPHSGFSVIESGSYFEDVHSWFDSHGENILEKILAWTHMPEPPKM